MTKSKDLETLAALMRRNAGKWMILDAATDRGRVAGRAHNWNHAPPRAFAEDGFTFRTRKAHDGRLGIVLEGRYETPSR